MDPEYPSAWCGLSAVYQRQIEWGLRPVDEGFPIAREAAQKALAIDPDFAWAHIRLGWIAIVFDRDPASAARHYERGLRLDPRNLSSIGLAANFLRSLGRLDETIVLMEYVVARAPVNSDAHLGLGWVYFLAGRVDDAIASFRTILTLSPDFMGGGYVLGTALMRKGDTHAALDAIQQESSELFRLILLSMVYHDLGQMGESDAALDQLIEKHEKIAAYNIAFVFAHRNEADRAFEWLDKAVKYNDTGLSEVPVDNSFANIHDDPRWLPFLESIGKSPEQLAAIEFNVTLPQ